jgi:GT2 family glycosyltransferase
MTSPAVSVVVPTWNRVHLLPASLASLLGQRTAEPFEVIVVDNASDDATPRVLAEWAARDARVRALREEVRGRTPALLAGMAAAVAPLLLFTDDDVVVDPGWVDAYAAFFARRPDAMLAGGPIDPIPATGAWPAWFSPVAIASLGLVRHDRERPLGVGEHVWGANMAARAELFERLGAWDATLGVRGDVHHRDPGMNEDIELQYRVRDAGVDVWYCPDARVEHRAEPRSPGWCLRRGFANGRNSYHRAPWPGMPVERRRGAGVGATAAWASALVRTVGAATAFRASPTRARFERAWRAAWASGWRMEDALSAGRRGGADRAARTVTRGATVAAARVAGDG